jgi:hypothetical protein
VTGIKYRRRLCLSVDLRKYSQHTYAEQADAQARLARVLKHALRRARVPRVFLQRQRQGDGQLLVLPGGLDDVRALPQLILGLRDGLFRSNFSPGPFGRLRMRSAMSQGSLSRSPNGYVGDCVVLASRMVDSTQLREALESAEESDLALAVTPDLYRDVIQQRVMGLPSAEFRLTELTKQDKEFAFSAWLYVPKSAPAWDTGPGSVRWGESPERTALQDYVVPAVVAAQAVSVLGYLASASSPTVEWRLASADRHGHAESHDQTGHHDHDHHDPHDHDHDHDPADHHDPHGHVDHPNHHHDDHYQVDHHDYNDHHVGLHDYHDHHADLYDQGHAEGYLEPDDRTSSDGD